MTLLPTEQDVAVLPITEVTPVYSGFCDASATRLFITSGKSGGRGGASSDHRLNLPVDCLGWMAGPSVCPRRLALYSQLRTCNQVTLRCNYNKALRWPEREHEKRLPHLRTAACAQPTHSLLGVVVTKDKSTEFFEAP